MAVALLLVSFTAIPQDAQPNQDPLIPLEIETAVELAFSQSKMVQIKQLAVDKSRAAVREARAMRGPSMQVQSSSSYLSNPPEGMRIVKGALGYAPTQQSPTPVAIPDQDIVLVDDTEHTYFSIRTTLVQPIFTWGKLAIAENLSRLGTGAASHELSVQLADTDAQVRTLYLGGLAVQKTVPILEEIVAIGEQIVADRNRSFDEGLIIKQVVLEGQSQLAGLVFQLAQSREGLRTAREAVADLTGISDGTIEFVSEFRSFLPELDEDSLVAATIDNSPDLALLDVRLEQARLAVDLAKASRIFRPDFSLSVTLDVTGQRIPIIGANWTKSWNSNLIVSIGTQVNLFDSGKTGAALTQAKYDLQMAATGVDAFTDGIGLQIRRSVELARTAYYETQYADAKLELSKEQAKNATVSFENEIVTREEYLGARLGLLLTELEHTFKAYAFDSSLVALEALTGLRFREDE